MDGPHSLSAIGVAAHAPYGHGAYLLVGRGTRGGLIIEYVGRSKNLARRLTTWIENGYTAFYFKETKSENGSFLIECREFHRYGKIYHLDNRIHPSLPPDSTMPLCSERNCRGEAA